MGPTVFRLKFVYGGGDGGFQGVLNSTENGSMWKRTAMCLR